MSRKLRKGGPSVIFHERNLISGLITDSLVADTDLERLISAINMKEAAPRHINNGKSKANMVCKKGASRKVVKNLRHSVMTPEYPARTLNIGLDKAKQMIRLTTHRGICTEVRLIIRIYI